MDMLDSKSTIPRKRKQPISNEHVEFILFSMNELVARHCAKYAYKQSGLEYQSEFIKQGKRIFYFDKINIELWIQTIDVPARGIRTKKRDYQEDQTE